MRLDTYGVELAIGRELVPWLPLPAAMQITPLLTEWLRLVRADYNEVPGLHLTKVEIQRMWGLDADTCDALVDALVESQFLRLTRRGRYRRSDAGA